MKIKILRGNIFSLATYDGTNFILGGTSLETVGSDLDPDIRRFIETCSDCSSMESSVQENEQFFYSKILYRDGTLVNESSHVGRLNQNQDGPGYILTELRLVSGQSYIYNSGDVVIITTYDPPDLTGIFTDSASILASDGVIILEENNFISNVGGEIKELTPQEVMQILSTYDAAKSPSYQSITVTPVLTRPDNPRPGTIILNQVTGKLEFYFNSQWTDVDAGVSPSGINL